MKKTLILSMLVAALALFSACDKKEDNHVSWQQTLKQAAELGTVEYTVKKIVKCNDKQRYTIGDRQILFSSTAYLKAGVKLDNFSEENVVINDKDVTVTLPHAELLSFNMPAEETHTVFENYGFFRSRFNAEEQNEILQLGEKDIRDDVPNLGILHDAEQNTKDIFVALLSQMGYENINILFNE